jgi:anti-anti-sigma regulatory factor
VSRKKPPRAHGPKRRQAACVELDARLDIAQAAELHRALRAHLAKGGPVTVDGTRVEEIDTAMLQLLASLWRTSGERGIACRWKGASGALRRTATLLGMAEVLNLPASEPM